MLGECRMEANGVSGDINPGPGAAQGLVHSRMLRTKRKGSTLGLLLHLGFSSQVTPEVLCGHLCTSQTLIKEGDLPGASGLSRRRTAANPVLWGSGTRHQSDATRVARNLETLGEKLRSTMFSRKVAVGHSWHGHSWSSPMAPWA